MRFRMPALGVIAALIGALPGGAYPRPGRTELVSVSSDGGHGAAPSEYPAVSADGRYAAFSGTSPLVAGDANGLHDVFVHDRATGALERVSVASDGSEGDYGSERPWLSADGRVAAFESFATNLVPGDTNRVTDVFVHDRSSGETRRVSVSTSGQQGNEDSGYARISATGRFVVFMTRSSTLVPGDTNGTWDAFLHDLDTGVTERVSEAFNEAQGNALSALPAVSADGRYVAFESDATNLVPEDTNGERDVFVRDRKAGRTERVSVTTGGLEAHGEATMPSISGDGRLVAFAASAEDLVPGDDNRNYDVYVHDRQTRETERVSVASDGAEADFFSWKPAISADGRFVAFESVATNLVAGDNNGELDSFVHDRATGVTERLSVSSKGVEGSSEGGLLPPRNFPVVSDGGRYAAFQSRFDNLVEGDEDEQDDVFIRDRGPAVGVGGLGVSVSGEAVAVSGWAAFSGTEAAAEPDARGDVGPGVRDAGGDLTGASVVFRPEQGDVLVRLRLDVLPSVRPRPPEIPFVSPGPMPQQRGVPGLLYALYLRFGGVRYEVRAHPLDGAAVSESFEVTPTPAFVLYRCTGTPCSRVTGLRGGIGTVGNEVRVAVPIAALGAAEGQTLTELHAYTAVGVQVAGRLHVLDEAVFQQDALLAPRRVELGVAAAGTPEGEVAFTRAAALDGGRFEGTLPLSGPGDHDVWARACLGEVCGSASARLALG